MFKSSKLKSFSNAIKTVSSVDTSAGISSKIFALQEISRYGINGNAVAMAFDPVQSLLAVATSTGEIHVFGQQQVEVVFSLERATIRHLVFIKGIYLVAIDSKDNVMIFSLHNKKQLTSFFSPGKITAYCSDPSLDWLILGLQNGTVIVYDVDRGVLSPIKIDNLQKNKYMPREPISPVVSVQWNPRDIGTILIAWNNSAVTYSFLEQAVKSSFIYDVPRDAPGGDGKPSQDRRFPKLIQALYHPNSLNLLTVHEDSSLVFWDANTGERILARTAFDTFVDQPSTKSSGAAPRIQKVEWICQEDPDKTSLMLIGTDNLTLMDLGVAPMYSVTSYDKMATHYASAAPKVFPLIHNIVSCLPLGRTSPYFSSNHNPGFVLVLLDSGELETLLYPSCKSSHKASLFPQSLSWIRPYATTCMASAVPNKQWLGMMGSVYNKDYVLKGGAPVKKQLRVHDFRAALCSGHIDGSVRIWDASHGELDDNSVFDINMAAAINKADAAIDHISLSGENAELAVATVAGDVALFKFQMNKFYSTDDIQLNRFSLQESRELIVDISDRAPPSIKEGFMPIAAVHAGRGRVSCLLNSDVGFVGIGYDDGTLIVVDRRGPAAIFNENIRKYCSSSKVTALNFSIIEYGSDGYSSIMMFAGTDTGEVLIFKVLPEGNGRFYVQALDSIKATDSSVVNLATVSKIDGHLTSARIPILKELSKGIPIPAFVIVSAVNEVRLFTPGKSKDTHQRFKVPIASSGLFLMPNTTGRGPHFSTALCLLHVDGAVRILSVPGLSEIKSLRLPFHVNTQFIGQSSVLQNGDIIVRVGKCEAVLLAVIPDATVTNGHIDKLYNPNLKIPYHPTVNGLQWARGTVYIKKADLDLLLTGSDQRPPSKYEESSIADGTVVLDANTTVKNDHSLVHGDFRYNAPVRKVARSGYNTANYVSRAVTQAMDSLETTMDDAATYTGKMMDEAVSDTRNDLLKGALRSKFGF